MNRFTISATAFLFLAGLTALQAQRPDFARGRGGDPTRMLQRLPLMKALDQDQDGEISTEEMERAATVLLTLDTNGDETLTSSELRPQGFGRPGGGRDRTQAWQFLKTKYDQDNNDAITKEEYDRDADTFAKLDRNEDDQLTQADWEGQGEGRNRGRDRDRNQAAPEAGDLAPDFNLSLVASPDQSVQLSGFKNKKPVALLFGSCT